MAQESAKAGSNLTDQVALIGQMITVDMHFQLELSLCVNDLSEQCVDVNLQMYADDTVIYVHAKTTSYLLN